MVQLQDIRDGVMGVFDRRPQRPIDRLLDRVDVRDIDWRDVVPSTRLDRNSLITGLTIGLALGIGLGIGIATAFGPGRRIQKLDREAQAGTRSSQTRLNISRMEEEPGRR